MTIFEKEAQEFRLTSIDDLQILENFTLSQK